MTDPVSKMEDVEDVLSSIRRLVADTSGGAPRDTEDRVDAPQEALVLTSAQRVNIDKPTTEAPISSLEALRKAVADPDAEANKVVTGGWVRPSQDEYYEDEAETAHTGWSEAQRPFEGPSADALDEADRPAFGSSIAPEEQYIEDLEEPIDDTLSDEEEAEITKLTNVDAPDEVVFATEQAPAQPAPEMVDPEPPAESGSSLVEELGVATFRRSTADTALLSEPQIEDASFVDMDAEVAETDTDDAQDASQTVNAEGDMINEALLREIVGEIVRKELGGELGERITRNVRKLVRREVHRALMAREFE